MDKLQKKTIQVSRGLTYAYYTHPAKDGRPTLFLAHGWPDTADLWSGLIGDYLLPNGYGIVAIDCLGYGGTDKPTDYTMYDFQKMTGDVIEILDKESLDRVVSTGHDWGCALAQRMYNFHPDRVIGVITLSVAYIPPGGPFDLDQVIEATQQAFSYGTYWYWKFFTADDGAEIMNKNVESVFDVAHGLPESWLDTFCKEDGMRNFVSGGKRQEVESYVTDDFRKEWVDRLKRDKFDGPQCWYVAVHC
jgi:soluble epoxide hydrolase / lipid-phosphate phosphatase